MQQNLVKSFVISSALTLRRSLITKVGIFKGEFVKGQLNGKCSIFFKNKDQYVGNLKQSKMNGEGWYKYSDGKSLIGHFCNGEIIKNENAIFEEIEKKLKSSEYVNVNFNPFETSKEQELNE